ncbi:hypothetical protein RFI_40374, partial [Reticulomyxa filosa]
FASIENDIYHTFVHGRGLLALDIPLFQYRNELDIRHCIATIETQFQEIRTSQIKSLWEHTHLSTISSMQKQKALEALNNAIVFLFNDLDQLHLDTPLTDLFQQLQFEKKDQSLFFIRSHAKSDCTTLCIKHIGALWRVLNNLVRSERLHDDFITPFVLEMYRHSLPNELQKQIKGFVKKTSLAIMKEVLDAWREIAYKQGQIERKQSNAQEFQLVFSLQQHLSENDLSCFPCLTWRFCAAAYRCAYQESKKKDQRLLSFFQKFRSRR